MVKRKKKKKAKLPKFKEKNLALDDIKKSRRKELLDKAKQLRKEKLFFK
jgi:hypothetical protein